MGTVNENWLVIAIRKLKAEGIIIRDKEVADMTGYSKEAISNMLSGNTAISKKFETKFREVFKKEIKQNLVSEPSMKYSNASAIDLGDRIIINVPLVGQYAYAGYLSGYADQEYVEARILKMEPRELDWKIKFDRHAMRKEVLTEVELRKLATTDCGNNDVKRLFLFCCNTGLRFGDAKALTWHNRRTGK